MLAIMVKHLLKCEANVNAVDKDGDTPLRFAIRNGNPEIVEELLQRKAD